MSPLRLTGSTSGYSQIDAPAVAGDQTFTLPGTGGTLDRLNRAGNILQVVQTVKTNTFSTSSTSFVDITGLSASITPNSTSSNILALVSVFVVAGGALGIVDVRLARGSTDVLLGDASGSIRRSSSALNNGTLSGVGNVNSTGGVIAFQYLDSPGTTGAVTYKVTMASSAGTSIVNATVSDSSRTTSSITLMEVAA